jgi:hypothetical protein
MEHNETLRDGYPVQKVWGSSPYGCAVRTDWNSQDTSNLCTPRERFAATSGIVKNRQITAEIYPKIIRENFGL